ncbi:MAG: RNA-protein complex protein Nop10 [Thermoplasmatota archaeon]
MGRTVMQFCDVCDEYTLQATCPRCHGPAHTKAPAKFSPEDPYGSYRRKLKFGEDH